MLVVGVAVLVSVAALVALAALTAVVMVSREAAAASCSHPGLKRTKRGGWIKKDTPPPGSKRGVWGKATPTPEKRAQVSTDIDGAAHSSAMPRMS